LKHGPEAADPLSSLSCTMTKADLVDLVQLYPATFDAYGEVTFWWIKPNKSHVTP